MADIDPNITRDVKRDIIGSWDNRSNEWMRQRAERLCAVSGVDNTVEGLKQAVEAASTGQFTHPNYPVDPFNPSAALPLKEGLATQAGKNIARVRLRYYRKHHNLTPIQPSSVGTMRANVKIGTKWYRQAVKPEDPADPDGPTVPAYDEFGLPNGILEFSEGTTNGQDPDHPPKSYILMLTGFSFFVPFVSEDLPAVEGLLDHINDDEITYKGVTFAPYTLKFTGMSFDWIEDQSSTYFQGYLTFEALRQGFFRQVAWFDEENNNPAERRWKIYVTPSHPAADFSVLP